MHVVVGEIDLLEVLGEVLLDDGRCGPALVSQAGADPVEALRVDSQVEEPQAAGRAHRHAAVLVHGKLDVVYEALLQRLELHVEVVLRLLYLSSISWPGRPIEAREGVASKSKGT